MVPVDVAFALAFGLVVLAASLLGMWAARRERTPNEPCSGGDGRGGTRAGDAEQGESGGAQQTAQAAAPAPNR
jgi:hypothetical protein